jgi:hypothetical protein
MARLMVVSTAVVRMGEGACVDGLAVSELGSLGTMRHTASGAQQQCQRQTTLG